MKKHTITESCPSGVFVRYLDFCDIDVNTGNSLVIYGILPLLPKNYYTFVIAASIIAFHPHRQIASIERGGTVAGEGRRLLEGVSLPEKLRLKLAESRIFESGCVALHYEEQ